MTVLFLSIYEDSMFLWYFCFGSGMAIVYSIEAQPVRLKPIWLNKSHTSFSTLFNESLHYVRRKKKTTATHNTKKKNRNVSRIDMPWLRAYRDNFEYGIGSSVLGIAKIEHLKHEIASGLSISHAFNDLVRTCNYMRNLSFRSTDPVLKLQINHCSKIA